MAVVYFPSLAECDVVEVELSHPSGSPTAKRLLVDSGFTGDSSLILSEDDAHLALATIAASF